MKAEQIPFSLQLLPLEALNSIYSAHHSKRNPPTQVFLTFADWAVECHQPGQNFPELVASNQLLVPLAEHRESEDLLALLESECQMVPPKPINIRHFNCK